MQKRESMKKKKIKRRKKRIRDNNRKTVGKGWNTQKTERRGITRRKRDGNLIDSLFSFPEMKFPFSPVSDEELDRKELKKGIKRIGVRRDEKH